MTYRIERYEQNGPPEVTALRHAMERDGYNVFEWSDRAGTIYATHEHNDDQSHCIVSGQLELNIEGEGIFILGPGDRDFMPAGTRHSARVIGEEILFYLIGSK